MVVGVKAEAPSLLGSTAPNGVKPYPGIETKKENKPYTTRGNHCAPTRPALAARTKRIG